MKELDEYHNKLIDSQLKWEIVT